MQDVAAPLISSEVDSTIVPSRMPGSYLTVDSRMDGSPITVKFSAKEAPELVLEEYGWTQAVSQVRGRLQSLWIT